MQASQYALEQYWVEVMNLIYPGPLIIVVKLVR